MDKKQVIGMVIAAVLFVGIGASSVITREVTNNMFGSAVEEILAGDTAITLPQKPYIAIVKVEGTIEAQRQTSSFASEQSYRHKTTLDYIDSLIKDSNNQGILLYVDSPGGAVYESEELYLKLEEYKNDTERPIWNYMAHYAASGGYYVGMMSDVIYAHPNTITGSIGVVMGTYDLSGLYEKLGIREVVITSGENKVDTFTEEQIQIYQAIVDEYYGRFVEVIAKGRDMTEEEVITLADGRVYTAKQAREHGLIDEIGLYEEMKEAMSEELGVKEYHSLPKNNNVFSQFMSEMKAIVPKSEAQILRDLSLEKESEVWRYYADIVQ